MTQEILILLAVLLLLFTLTSIQVVITMMNYGTVNSLGGRDEIPYLQPGLGGRLHRAIANLKEGLHLFTPIILLTAILGVSNDQTLLGAKLFLIARVLHAPLYISGIVSLRTLAYFLSIIGIVLIVSGLLTSSVVM